MATQIIAPSQIVPFPVRPAPEEITQFELAALLSLRNRVRQLAEQIEAAEQSIRTRLETGAPVEAGERTAEIKEHFRRNVSWREVATRLAAKLYGPKRAEAYCENVLQNAKPSRTVSLAIF
jgi:hypothetical protein